MTDGIVDVKLRQRRNQVDKVLGSHQDASSVLPLQIADVLLLELLDLVRLSGSEFPCKVVAFALEGFSDVGPESDVEDAVIHLKRFFVYTYKINFYLFVFVECKETTPVSLLVLLIDASSVLIDDA